MPRIIAEKRELIIKKYLENRISQIEIAKEFGINVTTVNSILKGLKPKMSLDEKEVVRLYQEEKLSVPKIARKLQCSNGKVYPFLRRENLVRNMRECHLGQIAWNKGKPLSLKQRKKIGRAHV